MTPSQRPGWRRKIGILPGRTHYMVVWTAEALEQVGGRTSVKRPRVVEELTERGDVEAIFVAEGGALQPDERCF